MPQIDRDGDVWILNLGDGENRFHPDWMTSVADLVREVAESAEPRALVTSATGKIWSNGLDLDWLGQNHERIDEYVAQVLDLFAQVLALPVPTVAAVQGHVFAGGAMLALAHDWRVMRADRGWFCLPEADIRIPFTPGMSALIQAKLTPATATTAMVGARRFGGVQALEAGIVTAAVPEESVLSEAVALAAAEAGKDGKTLGVIKTRMYADVLAALGDRERNRLVAG